MVKNPPEDDNFKIIMVTYFEVLELMLKRILKNNLKKIKILLQ